MQIDSPNRRGASCPAMPFLRKVIPLSALLVITACAGVKTPHPETPAGAPHETSVSAPPQSASHYVLPEILPDPERGLKIAIEALKGGNPEAALVIARLVSDQYPQTPWYRRSLFLTM